MNCLNANENFYQLFRIFRPRVNRYPWHAMRSQSLVLFIIFENKTEQKTIKIGLECGNLRLFSERKAIILEHSIHLPFFSLMRFNVQHSLWWRQQRDFQQFYRLIVGVFVFEHFLIEFKGKKFLTNHKQKCFLENITNINFLSTNKVCAIYAHAFLIKRQNTHKFFHPLSGDNPFLFVVELFAFCWTYCSWINDDCIFASHCVCVYFFRWNIWTFLLWGCHVIK